MQIDIIPKFDEIWKRLVKVRADIINFRKFLQLRGHNSLTTCTILLIIELVRDIMPIDIIPKFEEIWKRFVKVREKTPLISINFRN